ncbi:MAG: N-acetyltransferase [Candidatus Thorarchaeota archaeon]|nr:N-acetyltransferase [Candidatus Thorarchaeota archaeon]
MIKVVEFEKTVDMGPLIERFKEAFREMSISETFLEQLKTSVSNGKNGLFGAYDKEQNLKGIGLFGKASGRILLIYANGDIEIEKQLINEICNKFLGQYSYIATGGSWIHWISASISQHLLDIGFAKYDRASMAIPRSQIESLAVPVVSSGMSFEPYKSSKRDEISDLIFRGNYGNVDQEVFPDFFGSPDNCVRLVENIEKGRYGEYKEGTSWILRDGSVSIGACFITTRSEDAGYISDIVIDPGSRGKGLGRALLIHSMKQLLESESSISKIELDVTLSNKARYLYELLGFKTVETYSTYTLKE